MLCNGCMGLNKNIDSDEVINQVQRQQPVYLNVYNMYRLNDITNTIGLGIYHSGVEIYGIEYGYGGHLHNYSGIFEMEPRNDEILSEFFNMRGQLRFKQSILIGYTNYSAEEVQAIKNRLERKYQGNKYHLINNNCNHFSANFTKILCKKSIPGWVNRLAYIGSFLPFLYKIFPNEWLGPSCLINTQDVATSMT